MRDAPIESGQRSGRTVMLAALSLAAFLATGSGIVLAPFLLDMATDLQTDLAASANLVSILSITWGATSLLTGAASDRVGRRPILVIGMLALGASQIGVATSWSYAVVVLWQLVGGFGGGAFTGTVFAAVSDNVAPGQHGRALGWIVVGQSLSLVLGVPLATYIGSFVGWRGALLVMGSAMLLTAVAVWLTSPGRPRVRGKRESATTSLARLRDVRILALLGAGTMERVSFGVMAVYLATYLMTSYGLPYQALAVGLALVAVGNLLGNMLGSQLTDRLPARPLFFAASSLVAGGLAVPLLLTQPGLAFSLGLGFTYALANAIGRPALLASLSTVPSDIRGAVLGLHTTFAAFGWLAATAIGGQLVTHSGFGALSFLSASACVVGALLATIAWLVARRASDDWALRLR